MRSRPLRGFELLFHAYYAEVCRHIYRYIANQSTVEDIAQELFAELWDKRDALNITTSPGAYLHRMAVTRALNYIRDNKKHTHESADSLGHQESSEANAIDIMSASELSEVITKAIDGLPERCRQVFMLSRFEGMSNKEVSEALSVSVKTVENQMTKALKILRKHIEIFRKNEIGGTH